MLGVFVIKLEAVLFNPLKKSELRTLKCYFHKTLLMILIQGTFNKDLPHFLAVQRVMLGTAGITDGRDKFQLL